MSTRTNNMAMTTSELFYSNLAYYQKKYNRIKFLGSAGKNEDKNKSHPKKTKMKKQIRNEHDTSTSTSDKDVVIFWSIDDNDKHDRDGSRMKNEFGAGDGDGDGNKDSSDSKPSIRMAVAVRLNINTRKSAEEKRQQNKSGEKNKNIKRWIGFGLSDMGGMVGSDIFIHISGSKQILDCHGNDGYVTPKLDMCGQDWKFVSSSWLPVQVPLPEVPVAEYVHESESDGTGIVEDEDKDEDIIGKNGGEGWFVVEVTRSNISSDVNEDRPFLDDASPVSGSTKIIVAWGELNDDPQYRRHIEADVDDSAFVKGEDGKDIPLSASNNGSGEVIQLDDDDDDDDDLLSAAALLSRIKPHGPSNRVKDSIRFFGDKDNADDRISPDTSTNQKNTTPLDPIDDQADAILHDPDDTSLSFIDLIPKTSYKIPPAVTTYKNFCFSLSDFPELELNGDGNQEGDSGSYYIVKFEDIVSENNSSQSLVHHMDLHGTSDAILGKDSRLCRTYMSMVHPWEAGSPRTFTLPPDVGIPLGDASEDGYKGFRVEVHYHNPSLLSNVADRSGVRIYYTRQKPKYIAGLMLLGDRQLYLMGLPTVSNSKYINTEDSNDGGMRHSFYCPPSCFTNDRMDGRSIGDNSNSTNDARSLDGVTVFKEVFHMHKSGARMTNTQFNNNGEISRATEINYFDFSQGAGFSSRDQVPFQIGVGDSLITTCYFEENGVVFGSGSGQEMCQVFLWYYPKSSSTLSCGYYDRAARQDAQNNQNEDKFNPQHAHGCEMGYDSASLRKDENLERWSVKEELKVRVQHQEQCQIPSLYGTRPFHDFLSASAINRSQWPSLYGEKMSDEEEVNVTDFLQAEAGSNDTNSIREENVLLPNDDNSSQSTPQLSSEKVCSLCVEGHPSLPHKELEGYESEGAETGWTCEEMEAFIPLLFRSPELFDNSLEKDAPLCKDFQDYFGPMCGCPSNATSTSADAVSSNTEEKGLDRVEDAVEVATFNQTNSIASTSSISAYSNIQYLLALGVITLVVTFVMIAYILTVKKKEKKGFRFQKCAQTEEDSNGQNDIEIVPIISSRI